MRATGMRAWAPWNTAGGSAIVRPPPTPSRAAGAAAAPAPPAAPGADGTDIAAPLPPATAPARGRGAMVALAAIVSDRGRDIASPERGAARGGGMAATPVSATG